MGKYPALDFYYYDTDKIRENKVLYHEEDSFLNDVLHVSHVPSLLLMENGEKINVLTETEITESSFDYMVNNDEQWLYLARIQKIYIKREIQSATFHISDNHIAN